MKRGNYNELKNKPVIPSIAGLVPNTRTLTINGATYDLSANRTWTISAVLADGTYGEVVVSAGGTVFTLGNAAVIAKVLTGFVAGAGTVAATDTILQAFQKIVGNINALITGVSSVNGNTGAVVLDTDDISEATNLYFTDERAQDAVAATFTDPNPGSVGNIIFGYDDTTNEIWGNVEDRTINFANSIQTVDPGSDGIVLGRVGGTGVGSVSQMAGLPTGFFASQAQMETGSSTVLSVSPGVQHYHPSAAKCWAYVTVSGGTPTLQSSYNITSITDTGVGQLTITIATDFSSAAWSGGCTTEDNSTTIVRGANMTTKTATSILIISVVESGSASDPAGYNFWAFGDQA